MSKHNAADRRAAADALKLGWINEALIDEWVSTGEDMPNDDSDGGDFARPEDAEVYYAVASMAAECRESMEVYIATLRAENERLNGELAEVTAQRDALQEKLDACYDGTELLDVTIEREELRHALGELESALASTKPEPSTDAGELERLRALVKRYESFLTDDKLMSVEESEKLLAELESGTAAARPGWVAVGAVRALANEWLVSSPYCAEELSELADTAGDEPEDVTQLRENLLAYWAKYGAIAHNDEVVERAAFELVEERLRARTVHTVVIGEDVGVHGGFSTSNYKLGDTLYAAYRALAGKGGEGNRHA